MIQTPTQIAQYAILSPLGSGGMSTVYLATDGQREYALKVMSPALAADPSFAARFMREAKLVANFAHPAIIPIYDFGCADNHYYYVMEYLPGGDLARRLEQGPLAAAQACRVILRIVEALTYAHAQGVIHRDIKPANVLFNSNDEAVLADFGIAKTASAQTRVTVTGIGVGTPHYMSPEQARGKALDARADLYSVGVMLYEMLVGERPFDGEDSFAIALMHIHDTPPALPDALSFLQPILDRLLAKQPEERFDSAADLGRALQHLLEQAEQVSARPVPLKRMRQEARSSHAARMYAGLAVAVLMAAGVWWVTSVSLDAKYDVPAAENILLKMPVEPITTAVPAAPLPIQGPMFDAAYHLELARNDIASGDWVGEAQDGAIGHLRAILAVDSQHAVANDLLIRLRELVQTRFEQHMQQGRYVDAVAEAQSAELAFPGDPIWVMLERQASTAAKAAMLKVASKQPRVRSKNVAPTVVETPEKPDPKQTPPQEAKPENPPVPIAVNAVTPVPTPEPATKPIPATQRSAEDAEEGGVTIFGNF